MQVLGDEYDLILSLCYAAERLGIQPLLHILSQHVARRVVTEWIDGDAVKNAFALDHVLHAHEFESEWTMEDSSVDMERLIPTVREKTIQLLHGQAYLLLPRNGHSLEFWIEGNLRRALRNQIQQSPLHDVPSSRLALMFLLLSWDVVELICEQVGIIRRRMMQRRELARVLQKRNLPMVDLLPMFEAHL
jgi:hypothetical protein